MRWKTIIKNRRKLIRLVKKKSNWMRNIFNLKSNSGCNSEFSPSARLLHFERESHKFLIMFIEFFDTEFHTKFIQSSYFHSYAVCIEWRIYNPMIYNETNTINSILYINGKWTEFFNLNLQMNDLLVTSSRVRERHNTKRFWWLPSRTLRTILDRQIYCNCWINQNLIRFTVLILQWTRQYVINKIIKFVALFWGSRHIWHVKGECGHNRG